MKRITRNERIKDIKPERDRGPAVLKFIRSDADHDPMFPRPKGAWVSGLDPLPALPASPTPATPEPVQELQQYYEQLPPPPPEQHNDHVMNYWNWRLDRLEAKRHG